MNNSERYLLRRLVRRIIQVPVGPRDDEAAILASALQKTRDDVVYLLLQRCLVLEMVLEQRRFPGMRTEDGFDVTAAPTARSSPHLNGVFSEAVDEGRLLRAHELDGVFFKQAIEELMRENLIQDAQQFDPKNI